MHQWFICEYDPDHFWITCVLLTHEKGQCPCTQQCSFLLWHQFFSFLFYLYRVILTCMSKILGQPPWFILNINVFKVKYRKIHCFDDAVQLRCQKNEGEKWSEIFVECIRPYFRRFQHRRRADRVTDLQPDFVVNGLLTELGNSN